MAIELTLTCQDDRVTAECGGEVLAGPTPIETLARITTEGNPYRYDPTGLGRKLFEALGGEQLTGLLDADPDGLLFLITDDETAGIPWEYAATPAGTFLVAHYGVLRLLPDARPATTVPPGPLNFVVLAADPLVDEKGHPRTGPKLNIAAELSEIARQLAGSGTALTARRVPPTKGHLQSALSTGPALLHLTCHGNVIEVGEEGAATRQAVLYLEDDTGKEVRLRSDHLIAMPPRGVLQLVVFSACHTAAGETDASLARAMVGAGTPAAVGMQGPFPDDFSGTFAANLYEFLLRGHTLAESLRQSRLAMLDDPYAIGLPVAYVAPGGESPFPRQKGVPDVESLTHPHRLSLPADLPVPRPFVGREWELHRLAALYGEKRDRVVTVVGSGGIGKTALSAAFADRFGWLFPGGVIGTSLANLTAISPRAIFRDLLERLSGGRLPPELDDALAEVLVEAFRDTARQHPPLVLLDNYESVLQVLHPTADEEEAAPDRSRPKVFLSYAREDEEQVRRLYRQLTEAGFDPWLDKEDILPGEQWLESIQSAIEAADFFAACLSPNSVTKRGVLQKEINQALDVWEGMLPDDIYLIPICLTPCELPERLARFQGVDWFAEDGLDRLVRAVETGMARRETGEEPPVPEPALDPEETRRFHQLVRILSQEGLPLLVTSRRQPAGLAGEVVFPEDRGMSGLLPDAGADLFLHHSSRAKPDPGRYRSLAQEVARETEGHPLAITLLAHEFDVSDHQTADTFLDNWGEELAEAVNHGLSAHHATFAVAFDRSFRHLSERQQARLIALSRFPAPFFAEGAALLWEEEVDEVQEDLSLFAHRNLLQVDAYHKDDTPATYRLEPVIARHLRARLAPELETSLAPAYAAYADWLVNRVYGELGREPALARLAQQWLDELIPQAEVQPPDRRGWYCWQLAWELRHFGRLPDELPLLQAGEEIARSQEDEKLLSRILSEQAEYRKIRGDLTTALALYEESLLIDEQLGDLKEKGATLGNMAGVYWTRGDLTTALALYEETLTILEQVGDLQGKGATLHNMARVYLTRGDLNKALALCEESLDIREQMGDLQGKGATLHHMAGVYLTRGDLNKALALYEETLTILEQVGDLRGKGATLYKMARVYLTRGDLTTALALYEETLTILEQVGDLEGKGATLSGMANIFMAQEDWAEAEKLVEEALAISEGLGAQEHIAFDTGKLGQVAQARGDVVAARRHYEAALAIHEQLGMPEAEQVRQMLASLEGGAAPRGRALSDATPEEALLALTNAAAEAAAGKHPPDAVAEALAQVGTRPGLSPDLAAYFDALALAVRHPDEAGRESLQGAAGALVGNWAKVVAPDAPPALRTPAQLLRPLARLFDRQEDAARAVDCQAQAIAYLREEEDTPENLQSLSVALYNYGTYLAQAERLDEAVAALEEVVAIDERLGLPDLDSDRAALERMVRRRDGLPPAEDAPSPEESQEAMQAQLEALPEAERERARQFLEQLERMSPAEREAALQSAARQSIVQQAEQIADAARHAHRQDEVSDLLPKLEEAAAHFAQDEEPGSPYDQLAQFTRAVVALLKGESPPPVPDTYAEMFAALKRDLSA